jgi:(R)-amidase
MPRETIRLAMAQLAWRDGELDRCVQQIEANIRAQGSGHDLIVFPETCTTGFSSRDILERDAQPIDGPIVTRIHALAREFDVAVVLGLAERAGKRLFNAAVGIGPEGVFLHYRKTHLWVDERDLFDAGNRLTVRNWRGLRLGLLICFDLEFPEPARVLAGLGAQLIIVPNGNMTPYGDLQLRAAAARAQENQLFVAIANRTGVQGNTQFCGRSAVINPFGEIIRSAGPDEPDVLSVSLDLSQLQQSRSMYDYLNCRRIGIAPTATRAALKDDEYII